ncbi:MAG: calcium/sodium antiporter [Thermomicrobiales bacterium]
MDRRQRAGCQTAIFAPADRAPPRADRHFLRSRPDLAVGNVIGSNIFNILFVLGLSATIAPLLVSQQLVRIDVPIMIAASSLLLLFAWDGNLNRTEGVLLFSGALLYTGFAIWQSRREREEIREEYDQAFGSDRDSSRRMQTLPIQLASVVIGLVLLVLGARWLVNGAVEVAQALGISELVIGLTILAVGTSLPEVATSIIAALRGERDIAVGNLVGSNISNILIILGAAGMLSPDAIAIAPGVRNFDLPVMIAVALACLPIFVTGRLIGRWEGLLFFGYYIAYTAYLILDASGHDILDAYSRIMLTFVVPLTALTLVFVTFQAIRGALSSRSPS